ncbi:MAG: hypothetical protein IKU54_02840 [Oscillospiraceae bacterium]|nr:hypothetical protein [Oscillospiraceae bacterium]
MKEKHIAGHITAALIIIVGLLSFPYVWFQVKADEFLKHDFPAVENVRINIDNYQLDRDVELTDRRSKNIVINALHNYLEYDGPLYYHEPLQRNGEHQIYCVNISYCVDGHSGDWIIYAGDAPEYNYIYSGGNFDAKFEANNQLLDIMSEFFEE